MLPFIIAAVAIFATSGVAIALLSLKGKKITVLGARETGKTTLINFLLNGELSSEYIQTLTDEKRKGAITKIKDLELDISEMTDVPGDSSSYASWKSGVKAAAENGGCVLYLVRGDVLMREDIPAERRSQYEARLRKDIRHLGEWLYEQGDKRPPLYIMVTHCDLVHGYADIMPNSKGVFFDKVQQIDILQDMMLACGGQKNTKVICGSLATDYECQAMATQLITMLAEAKS